MTDMPPRHSARFSGRHLKKTHDTGPQTFPLTVSDAISEIAENMELLNELLEAEGSIDLSDLDQIHRIINASEHLDKQLNKLFPGDMEGRL